MKLFVSNKQNSIFTRNSSILKWEHTFGYVGTASNNNILRGAILGQGDMNIPRILSIIKNSGYDKEISIEFEGMEDNAAATEYCLDTVRYFWDKI